jgi:hypothetical protein
VRLLSAISAALLVVTPVNAVAASGEITFCNKTPHSVFVAIAYQQSDESWMSRGWLSVDADKCYDFDTAIRVRTFYFRGESTYQVHHTREVWGKGKEFDIWENSNFQYYSADQKVSKARFVEFTKAPDASSDAITATVTFTADGSEVSVTDSQ